MGISPGKGTGKKDCPALFSAKWTTTKNAQTSEVYRFRRHGFAGLGLENLA